MSSTPPQATDSGGPKEGTPPFETQAEGLGDKGQNKDETGPKLFTRDSVKRKIKVTVRHSLYRDLAPFVFIFRLQLSKEAQARREKWNGLSMQEKNASTNDQILDEVADLLIEKPEGFGDFPDGPIPQGQDPGKVWGARLRQYHAETTDPEALFTINGILEAAEAAYWAAITPSAFPS